MLLEQLQQAHHLFCLHHGPSLSDLWVRISREKFCSTLDRFWTRFSRSWDVLLHGNPAADIFTGVKVSSGGELGFGVGEEEWGSGEREVLEDLTRRTEGLVDLVVARFGEPTPKDKDQPTMPESEALPWMGSGREPTASDGVIFAGTGAIERHSLRDVSLLMRQIYTNGDYAYGIRDNPQRERRKRRRPNPAASARAANGSVNKRGAAAPNTGRSTVRGKAQRQAAKEKTSNEKPDTKIPRDSRPEIHTRVASQDHASTPEDTAAPQESESDAPQDDKAPANVPPMMASAVEQALDKTTDEADKDAEREGAETRQDEDEEAANTTLGIPDQYMKYLTFGLSTFAKPAPKKRPPSSRQVSTASSSKPTQRNDDASLQADPIDEDDEPPAMMAQLQPMPDGESIKSKIATQKRLENQGYFLVGLKGDLNAPAGDDEADATDGSFGNDTDGSRIVLRTVQVKVVEEPAEGSDEEREAARRPSLPRLASQSEAAKGYRRLRAIIYAHRPFVYCFLFEASTPSLQYTSFYRTLRQNLMPIHKPLLSSTSAEKVAQRIENSVDQSPAAAETASITSRTSRTTTTSSKTAASTPAPIFDLIYDPKLLTVHTSIPNIPEPGTPAAEGIFSTVKIEPAVPGWTRIEAMNVHSQILNTLASVKKRRTEVERTSKTGRGWWVVWMKVPPSGPSATADADTETLQPATTASSNANASTQTLTSSAPGTATPAAARPIAEDLSRIAFLVRRATDAPASSAAASSSRFMSASSSRAVSNMFSNMTFGLAGSGGRGEEDVGAGWGPPQQQQQRGEVGGGIGGVGLGVDARRYVEGLLGLGR